MQDFEKLLELTDLLLERVGITQYSQMEEDDMDEAEWAARTGGVEGWSVQFASLTYILFPQDMQELLMEMAHIVHEYKEDGFTVEFSLDDDEEEEG